MSGNSDVKWQQITVKYQKADSLPRAAVIWMKNSDFFFTKCQVFDQIQFIKKTVKSVYYNKFIKANMDFRRKVRISG